ncbi:MAG TPA: CusA/CzcA family heavy metal efflux RND transporter [Gemmatimonadaceae bacterium]|nr:CusA/CzcA family heavy metal efflux RND transporter [Gemmatimonadaceae bacterium]
MWIEALVTFCLRRRTLIFIAFLLVAALGIYSWNQLAIEAYPDIADVTSQVITQVPGLAAEEVEQQITVPIERELAGMPGLVVMRSKSTFALSLITLVFKDGVDDYWSRQRILERLTNVNLPPGITPSLDPLTSPIGEIYRYTLESPGRTSRELRELQEWVVIPALKQVFGVVDVSNFGGVPTQFQLTIDPAKLAQYGLSLSQVTSALQANNQNSGGSILVHGDQGFVVRGIGLIGSLNELGSIVLTEKRGTPVLVRDIGRMELSSPQRQGILGKNDNPDGVSGIVLLLKGENASRTLVGVHKKVDELNARILPADVKVVSYLDRTTLVDTTLHTVTRTVLEGIGLVFLVLVLYLGSVRGAAIVAVTIPLALLTAFIGMHLTNIPANLLSLGAIDFGIIVDGAIVVTENMLRWHEADPDDPLLVQDAIDAATAVARPIFFATLIIITAYLPLFAFQRVERKLFTPMAFTVSYALLGALAAALMLVPCLAYLAYRTPGPVYHNPWLAKLSDWYDTALDVITRRPKVAVIPGIAAAVLALVLGAFLGRDFLPYLDEGSIWLQVELPPGIALEKASDMAGQLRGAVREFPEVSYVVTQLGRNDDGTDPWTPSHIEASIGLKPYKEWDGDKQALIARMDHRLSKIPGISYGFSQPMIDGVNDKIAGAHSDLVVKVYGDDFAETRRIAEQLANVLKDIRGAADVAIDQEPPLPQLQIHVNREAAARVGVNVADVAALIETAIGGKALGSVFIGARRYDLTTRYTEESRATPDEIANLTLTTASGARIPLSQVAAVQLGSGESTITHESTHRQLTVKLNLRGRDLASFLDEAQSKIATGVKYDASTYRIEWGGQFENQQRALRRLAIIIPIVLAVIFALLYANFGDVPHAALVLTCVPLALLGGVVALLTRGMTLNVSSAVGFIALFGVAIQNGVIMVANLNRWHERGTAAADAVRRGAAERLRPVLMTASVATLGLVPAATAHGVGSDVQRPLATVIVGGLVSATALTLFVLPAMYCVVENRRRPKTKHLEA